jgi:hypothetical protein
VGGLTDFDNVALGRRNATRRFDGLVLRRHLDHPVAADDFLRFGEWAVLHSRLATLVRNARALGGAKFGSVGPE